MAHQRGGRRGNCRGGLRRGGLCQGGRWIWGQSKLKPGQLNQGLREIQNNLLLRAPFSRVLQKAAVMTVFLDADVM